MRRTIGFVNTSAHGTGSTGVPRVYQDHRNTRPFRLVLDEGTQLEKRPTMQGGALAATNRNPPANTRQIFESNRTLCVFRLGHNLPTNAVVSVLREASFCARESLEFALGRPCAFGLQLGAQAAMTVAHIIDVTTRMDFTITIYGDVRQPQVHPQRAFHVNGFGFFRFTGCRKKKRSPIDAQVAFALTSLEQCPLSLPADERDAKPAAHRPNRDSAILQSPRQDTVIVGDAPRPFEGPLGFAVKFVGVGNFSNRPYPNLGRQIKLFPHILIAGAVQVILSKGFLLPGKLTDELASEISLLNRLFERVSLFGRGEQFDLGNEFHASHYRTGGLFFQVWILSRAVLAVSLDGFGADMAGCANIVTFGPKRCFFALILAAQNSKFLHKSAGGDAFEQAHDFGRSELGRRTYKQMHIVGHYLNRHDFKLLWGCNLGKQLLQTFSDFSNQNLFAIPQYPNQVIADIVDSMGCPFRRLFHALILSLEGVVVAASFTRSKRVVSAA